MPRPHGTFKSPDRWDRFLQLQLRSARSAVFTASPPPLRYDSQCMGLDANAVTFLLHAQASGVRFDRTATLGRQRLFPTSEMLNKSLARFGYTNPIEPDLYAESLLRLLGAASIRSIDASAYEGATDLVDLNIPIPAAFKQQFTAVIDGGTLEHVFNFPVAIRNAMEMVAEGGHYLAISPTNNYAGHGFYQFSAELYFRIFSEENGFRLVRMLLYDDRPSARWYEVIDPRVLGRRATLINRRPTRLAVLAERFAAREIFTLQPIQSDYEIAWRRQVPSRTHLPPFLNRLWRLLPGDWRHALAGGRNAYRRFDPNA